MLKIKVYNEAMPEKINWNENMIRPGSLSVGIGSIRGGVIYHDFDKRKSLIVAGVPGSGKSAVIKLIIATLTAQWPEDVEFSLIDLKEGAAFKRFENMRQTVNFGTNEDETLKIFTDVQEKMNETYRKIVADGFEDITEAGVKKRHFLIIDEAADLVDHQKHMKILTDIVRKGRAAGFYVIYATQYPSAQAIPMQIKRNIPARLSFVLDSGTASTTVLDSTGAEDLPDIPGRGIYKDTKRMTFQAPYITNAQIKKIIEPHIVSKPKKGDQHERPIDKKTEDRKYSLEFKKV
jgi:S-DNA-T family DNA segregation ATPase FtsK/SpoIIIE